jgi:hypothetical protein
MTTDLSARVAELLPCPFCGGSGVLQNYIVEACVKCTHCSVAIVHRHARDTDSTAVQSVIAAWNKRLSGTGDADGWIEWKGGECPVDRNSIVSIKMRGCGRSAGSAFTLDWFHRGRDGDIIAYRLAKIDSPEGK